MRFSANLLSIADHIAMRPGGSWEPVAWLLDLLYDGRRIGFVRIKAAGVGVIQLLERPPDPVLREILQQATALAKHRGIAITGPPMLRAPRGKLKRAVRQYYGVDQDEGPPPAPPEQRIIIP